MQKNIIKGIIRLPPRYETLRMARDDYKLISLFESLRVQVQNGEGILDILLPMLKNGCEYTHIINAVSEHQYEKVNEIINDLLGRGIIENIEDVDSNKFSQSDMELYREQMKFFSNFYSLFDPQTVGSITKDNSFLMQKRLKDSKVMIIGLGRIGSRVTESLSCIGIGEIRGHDPEMITVSDVADGSYKQDDMGKPKGDVLKTRLAKYKNVNLVPMGTPSPFHNGDMAIPNDINLVVLCEDKFDPEHHTSMNKVCLQKKIPWISYRNLGLKIEIGPTVIPYETACFMCYQLRKASNSSSYEESLAMQMRLMAQSSSLGTLNVSVGADMLVLEIVKILTNFSSPVTYSRIFSFDIVSFQATIRTVLKIPRCPECGRSHDRPAPNVWQVGEFIGDL